MRPGDTYAQGLQLPCVPDATTKDYI